MRLGPILLSLSLVAALTYWFVLRQPQAEAQATAPIASAPAEDDVAPGLRPVSVMVLESDAQETVAQLTIRGRTEANRHVNVAAETTGIVTSQPLRRGVEVVEGQVLCELSPGTREAQLQEARARVAQARADFAAADRLSERGFGAETTRMARSAELEAALAALDLVTWDIERLEITAPFSGFLESDTAEIGARLAPGDICANVIDLSVVKVTGFVGEQSVDQLTIGNTARARLINGMEVAGMISFISRMADEDTRTFLVEVTLDNQEGRLRDGMTAELLIDLPPFTAHRVPQSALTLDDEGRIGLRIASGATARFIPIRVIRDEADGVWIQGAGEQLPDRMQLIVVGQEFVRDGRAIQPVTISWDDLG